MCVVLQVLLMGFLLLGVQCNEFSATLPAQIEALHGSCVTIPCSFQVQDQYRNNLNSGCRALWTKAGFFSVFAQDLQFTRTTTGDLTQNNCTTTMHDITAGGEVHFRVECDNDLKWTFTDTIMNIKVNEAPPTPTLTPPTLNVRKGESVTVQCSAPVPCPSLPPTLTWSPDLGDIQETLQETQDKTYVKVSTLNFTASHPEMTITCSAVYSREDGTSVSATALVTCAECDKFSVSLPQQIEGFRGSCVTIPCSFQIQNKYWQNLNRDCKALWKDSSDNTVTSKRQKTGDVTQKNCTTTFYDVAHLPNGNYFFRLECDNELKYSYKIPSVNIQVNEAPPTPTLTPPTLNVREGESVTVQCSAPVPCLSLPHTLTWSPDLGDIQETLQETQDKTYVQVSTLNFTASHIHHDTNITCSAVYSREDGTNVSSVSQLISHVTYQPRNTRVSHVGPVKEHSNVTLKCSSDANPAVKHYHWYKTDGGTHTLIGNSSVLNIKASIDTTVIFCEAQSDLGTDCSTVTQLDVQYPPRNTTMTVSPAVSVTEHSNMTLKCSSDANPAVKHYHWYKTDGGTHTVIGNSSVLNIKASKDTTVIFCEAQNHLGTDRSTVTQLDVQFSPQIVNSLNCTGDTAQIRCLCETEGNPFPKIHWYFPGVSPNISISSEHLSDKTLRSVIIVEEPQLRDLVTLVCHSSNSLGSDGQRFNVLAFARQAKPRNTRVTVSPPGPVTEHSNVTLKCSSLANPAVKHYHWYKTDGGTHTVIGNSSVLNIKASKDTTVVFCEAQNELGNDNSTVTQLDVQYQPQNTTVTVNPSGPVAEYSNVTLNCSSDANPAVKHYRWYKDDGGTHTVIGNTSVLNIKASKGTTVIFCEALNELGTDRSPVTQLDVQYRPRKTTINEWPLRPVTEHSNVKLQCSSDANPAVQHYRWYKTDGGAHTLIGNTAVLNMKASKNTAVIFCEAQNELGTDNSTVTQLDVQFAPQILSSSNCTEDKAQIRCLCETEGNPFPMIQWDLSGISTIHSISSEPLSDKALRSVITVIKLQRSDPFTLVCHSRNSLGSDRQQLYVQAFLQEGIGGEMTYLVLIAVIVILLALMGVLLYVIRLDSLNKRQSTDVAMDQLQESHEICGDSEHFCQWKSGESRRAVKEQQSRR